jgi:hypothetical protein
MFEKSFWLGSAPYHLDSQEQRTLTTILWCVLLLLILAVFFSQLQIQSMVAAILITVSALLPSYWWCKGKARGLPILPVYSVLFIPTYVAPLIFHHHDVMKFTPSDHLAVSIKLSLALLISCAVWLIVLRRKLIIPRTLLQLDKKRTSSFFLVVIVLSTIFQILSSSGASLHIPFSLYTLTRGIVLGLNTLGVFVLAYYWGEKSLSNHEKAIFGCCFLLYCMAHGLSLLIISIVCNTLLALVGYTIAARRLPVIPLLLALLLFSLLHIGKIKMREKYWVPRTSPNLSLYEYPQWYAEWISTGIKELIEPVNNSTSFTQYTTGKLSFINRASLLHISLLVQKKGGSEVPYLMGETYSVIPKSLVPRILWKNKVSPHQATSLLNIHYGLQSEKSSKEYSIGWGLFNESFANLGLLGIILLAVIQGAFIATVTRWSAYAPIFSLRALFAVVVISFAVQTEWTAAVYCSALFHATVALLVLAFVYMKPREVAKR